MAHTLGVYNQLDWGQVDRAILQYDQKVTESETKYSIKFKARLYQIMQWNTGVTWEEEYRTDPPKIHGDMVWRLEKVRGSSRR